MHAISTMHGRGLQDASPHTAASQQRRPADSTCYCCVQNALPMLHNLQWRHECPATLLVANTFALSFKTVAQPAAQLPPTQAP